MQGFLTESPKNPGKGLGMTVKNMLQMTDANPGHLFDYTN